MNNLASDLWTARWNGTLVDHALFSAADPIGAAYTVQGELNANADRAIVGWKIGATAATSQNMLGLDGPFTGAIFEGASWQNGETIPLHRTHKPGLEAEIAVSINGPLPPRARPYERPEIEAVVAGLHPSFELVMSRFDEPAEKRGPWVIADGGANGHVVVGAGVPDWRAVSGQRIDVQVWLDDEEKASGSSDVLMWGDPIDAVVWLANFPHIAPRGMQAGDIILTGTVSGIVPIGEAHIARADFGLLGGLSVSLTGAD